jgi:hypothetical protein
MPMIDVLDRDQQLGVIKELTEIVVAAAVGEGASAVRSVHARIGVRA